LVCPANFIFCREQPRLVRQHNEEAGVTGNAQETVDRAHLSTLKPDSRTG